eukprot:GILJ01001351.1.p1 GENE.GILJ01001351.1~~GILJ01001351.1.p1  ORF type:complete len:539 (-),score=95.89 GILJ01001351.1:92-1708(-)
MEEGQPSSSIQFGLMNSLRTGNMIVDMMVCMLVPLLLTQAGHWMKLLRGFLKRCFDSARHGKYTRVIEYIDRSRPWYCRQEVEHQNRILQKAISLYIADKKLKNIDTLDIKLMNVQETSTGGYGRDTYGSTSDQLETLRLAQTPAKALTVEVEPGVWFSKTEADDSEPKDKNYKIIIRYSISADSEARIDEFVSAAFEWYKSKVREQEDPGRYMYQMVMQQPAKVDADDEASGSVVRVYKRYPLSDQKTFDSLFFPGKSACLKLLDEFNCKKGKFAVPGFPQKLGLLLHGPPGTGKTSFIKALAHHTKRHIVNIPLSKIETNQQLMDSFFDRTFTIAGEDMATKLRFDQIVFVMEDIDCASDVVLARTKSPVNCPANPALTRQISNQQEEASADLLLASMMTQMMEGTDLNQKKKSSFFSTTSSDKLDLSGLLNVLDGVVDCPDRILIMTSNHPEKLDPALIRPGRINQKIYLGYIQLPELLQMTQLYFGQFSGPLQERLSKVFEERRLSLTPARVEQLCVECETVNDFITALSGLES